MYSGWGRTGWNSAIIDKSLIKSVHRERSVARKDQGCHPVGFPNQDLFNSLDRLLVIAVKEFALGTPHNRRHVRLGKPIESEDNRHQQ